MLLALHIMNSKFLIYLLPSKCVVHHHQKNKVAEENLETPKDFPGGAVVKNPPANAGDKGLSPGPGRSHMPQSN